MEKKANHFSGQIGFVLAAAGSNKRRGDDDTTWALHVGRARKDLSAGIGQASLHATAQATGNRAPQSTGALP